MQNAFSATSLPKDRGCGAGLTERTEFGLCDHVSDTLHPAAVHDTLRPFAVGLQRSPVHFRRSARRRRAQGKRVEFYIFISFIF